MFKIVALGKSGNEILRKYDKVASYNDFEKFSLNQRKDLKIIDSIKNSNVLIVGGLGGNSTRLIYEAILNLKMNRCKVVVLATIPFNVEPKKKWIVALDATDFIDESADESIIAYSNCLVDLKEKNYAIDVAFEKDGHKYVFTDTAGLRKRGKIDENIERYSAVRTLLAIDRSDVVIIMVDANEGVTEQDTKIAGYAHDNGKAMIVAVNKWDVVEKETNTMKNSKNKVLEGFNFMMYAPIEFISAKTGSRVDKLFELIHYVNEQNTTRIQTGVLNDVLNQAILRVQPPSDKGKRLKIYYMTQVGIKPPTFVIFVNNKELAHFSYVRYLENQIRDAFGLKGTPLKFIVREKGEEKQ